VTSLKRSRAILGIEASQLPILRLDPSLSRHRSQLTSLGVAAAADTVTLLLCERGGSGWPRQVLAKRLGTTETRDLVKEAIERSSESFADGEHKVESGEVKPVSTVSTELGILLVRKVEDPAECELVESFLTELGRYWMQRYGRVKPTPYPLAYYNVSDEKTLARLQSTLPELVSQPTPLAAVCFYSQGRPVQVLEVHTDLDLPATLVRQLSSARRRHLADTVVLSPAVGTQLPTADAVSLTGAQQMDLVQSRVHEMAQQLWAGSSDGDAGENRLARRLLLKLTEQTHGEEEWTESKLTELKETLEDFMEEPLLLPKDSELVDVQARLLAIGEALTQ
jgi:hypothetical protein